MLCQNCSKLSKLESKRHCVRCTGTILDNISCICEACSKEQNLCAVCLKRMNIEKPRPFADGCKSCGRG